MRTVLSCALTLALVCGALLEPGSAADGSNKEGKGDNSIKVVIEAPTEGAVIKSGVYDDMRGTAKGNLGAGKKLWVLAQDRYNYFLMYPEPTLTNGEWTQSNIRLTAGRWQLHVVTADAWA